MERLVIDKTDTSQSFALWLTNSYAIVGGDVIVNFNQVAPPTCDSSMKGRLTYKYNSGTSE